MGTAENDQAKLWELIKEIRFAMFGTHHENGRMHSRPMTTQNSQLTDDDCLWFFMSKKGETFADIQADSNVSLSYSHPGKDVYVSISGSARLDENPERIHQLWSKLTQAWFPDGEDDPDLALVEVRITHAHYWNVEQSKMTQLFMMAKASVTRAPPTKLGESVEVSMGHEK